MKINNTAKIVITACLLLLIVQLAWLYFFYNDMNQNYVKAEATVTELRYGVKGKTYPVYEFYDQDGQQIVVDRYFEGDCGFINVPCKLMQPDAGDLVTVYYEHDNPRGALILSGNFLSGDVRFIPLVVGQTIGLIACMIIFLQRYFKSIRFTKLPR